MTDPIDLDTLSRADLPDVPRRVASAVDDWLVRMHGIMSGHHNVGLLLDLLAERGLRVVDAREVS